MYRGDKDGQGRGRGGNRGGGERGRGGWRGDRGGGRGGGFRGGTSAGGGRGASQQVIQVFFNSQRQDPKVGQCEDTLRPPTQAVDLGGLNLREDLPLRPAYGTRGVKVELTANYVELLPPSEVTLHRYSIHISPETTIRKHHRLIELLLQSEELVPFNGSLATDFRSTLLTKTKLSCDNSQIQVLYRPEGEDEPAAGAVQYIFQLTYTNALSIGTLIDYLTSTNISHSFGEKQEWAQTLNIFLNHFARSSKNITVMGSTKSFPSTQNIGQADLGFGLDVVRGFFSSVRMATCRILVNINVSHAAFYKAGPLQALMHSYGVNGTPALERFLRLVRIQTTHLKEKRNRAGEVIPRVKTIFGLARKDDGHGMAHPPRVTHHGAGAKGVEFWLEGETSSSSTLNTGAASKKAKGGKGKGKEKAKEGSTVPAASGKYISVFDFFRTTYNRSLQYPELPLINCGNREHPMYLPPEVCIVLQGQPSRSKLSGAQTQQMIRHAVRKPWENAASIIAEGIPTVGLDENFNLLLRSFGFSIKPGLIKVPGRILSGPKVMYKSNTTAEPRSGSWNMVNIKFSAGAALTNWSYLMVSLPQTHDSFDKESLTAVMNEFWQSLRRLGINADPPKTGRRLLLQHSDDPQIGLILQQAASTLQLLVIVLPEANMPLYKRIKTLADTIHGVHTICSVGSKLAKPRGQDQYMANVALKLNLKFGGINHIVQNKQLGVIDQDKTMVVGIDVTHPSPGSSSKAPSVSAMVASINKFLGQWPATLRIQPAKQEKVDDLTDMLKSRLQLWKTRGKHATFPENILVYRDGVSEGQHDMVVSQELPQLRRACEQLYPATDTKKGLPRFTVIICGKRHKTRFYPTTEQDCDRSGNTKPGTVVDRGVTEARNWDFFLQAHAALQGTARPCHYYIVHDEIFRQIYAKSIPYPFQNIADIVEDLTHSMCYSFGRATKAVSLCTPAYYADIVCERARCYLADLFDTPVASAAASVAGMPAGSGVILPTADKVQIHPRLRDTMFYI